MRPVFVDMLGALLASQVPGVPVPDELLEVRNMLATRWEVWERQRQEDMQKAEHRGEQVGRRKGEAALLLRLLERRFGALPDWVRDRIAVADTATIEDWSLRILDAANLDDVLA